MWLVDFQGEMKSERGMLSIFLILLFHSSNIFIPRGFQKIFVDICSTVRYLIFYREEMVECYRWQTSKLRSL